MSQERPQQVFHGNVGQAAAGNIVNLAARPHIDPEFARHCPRCSNANQLYAERCWVCSYDLAAFDRAAKKKEIQRRLIVGAIVGAALVWVGSLIGGTFALWVSGAGFILMLASASAMQDL